MASSVPTKGLQGLLPKTKAPAKKTPAKKAPGKTAPGKTIATVTDKGDFTPAKARALTKRITDGAAATVGLIVQAYQGRIWLALGYKTWDEYRDKEFGGAPLALSVVQRRAAVKKMADEGMSSRAIATMTGTDHSTASRDINKAKDTNGSKALTDATDAQVLQGATVDGGDNIIIDGEIVEDPQAGESSRTVTGLDGKDRSFTTKAKAAPEVNIVSVARTIAKELDKVTFRLGGLYDRDDYDENALDVDKTLQQAIDDFADLVGSERLGYAEIEGEGDLEPEPAPV